MLCIGTFPKMFHVHTSCFERNITEILQHHAKVHELRESHATFDMKHHFPHSFSLKAQPEYAANVTQQ